MVADFISNKFTMTTALLAFWPVGAVSIKIWLFPPKNEFHLHMVLYFIIYSAITRGGEFSPVEMFQLLFKKKIKQMIKQNYKFSPAEMYCYYLRKK